MVHIKRYAPHKHRPYLLELARYVVLNPVRGGICDLPEDWPWRSYQAMLGRITPPPWLHVRWLRSQFGNSPQAAVAAYANHVRAGVDLPSVWERLQGQMYLGDAEFVEVAADARLRAACLAHLWRRAPTIPRGITDFDSSGTAS